MEELAAILKNYTEKKQDREIENWILDHILEFWSWWPYITEIYSEPSQISKTELLVVNNFAKAPS